MAPVKPGRFKFDPESIAQVRNHLGLSQKKLAALLGVPANTLSRWETGATTPDADSLAAIYSVAAKHGLSAQFFRRRNKAAKVAKGRTHLLAFWDFHHLSPHLSSLPNFLDGANASVRQELDRRFPAMSSHQFKAFAKQSELSILGYQPTDELQRLGWRVWEDTEDLSDDIISQIKSDCGHEPENTILVLLTHPRRDEFADVVRELKSKGVAVYLMAPGAVKTTSLIKAVGAKHWIKLKGIPKAVKDRTRLLVFWDFQHLSPSSISLPNTNTSVREELDRYFPATSTSRFKVFGYRSQMTAELQRLGWGMREYNGDLSDEIISQSKSDCGHEPENTILVLLTHPGRDEFTDLVRELKSKGVEVYLMAPESTMHPWSREVPALVEAVGHEHWIKPTGPGWSLVQYLPPTVASYR